MAIEETLLIKLIIDVEQSTKAVEKLQNQFKGLSEGIKAAFSVSSNDGLKTVINQQKEATKAAETLTGEIRKQQKQFDATKFPEGSYRQLNAQLKDLNNRFKELSATEREGAIGQALGKDILRVKNQLKGIDASIGDFQRNVGNYAGSLRGFFKEINANLKSIGLRGAIRSLPNLFGLIGSAIENVQKGLAKLGNIFSATSRSSQLVAESQEEFVQTLVKEQIQLESNFKAATKDKITKDEKIAAINNINEVYGEYLPNLLTEKSTNEEIAAAQQIVNEKLLDNLVQKQKNIILEKAFNDVINTGLEANKQQALATATTTGSILDFFNATTAATRISSALATQEFETAKAVAGNGDAIEKQLKGIVEQAQKAGVQFGLASGETESLAKAQKDLAEEAEKTDTALERLTKRKSELETTIKNLALADKDYTAQQKELQAVNEQLAKADKAIADANKEAETNLERLTRRQKELTDEIQNAIANGEPYTAQLNEAISVTKELNGINEQYAKVQKLIDDQLRQFTEGSLSEYDARIAALQEKQKDLNITSEEYADITAQVSDLEKQRSTILDALALDVNKVKEEQKALDSQLSDQQAQNDAFERAKQRLSLITDATANGAEQIKQINEDLQNELNNIENNGLQKRLQVLDAQKIALEQEKQAELALVADSAKAKEAIEAKFAKESTDIELQQAIIKGEILKKEVEENSQSQEQITEKTSEEAQKRKDIQGQVLEAIGQISSQIFDAINQAQERITEKELARVEEERTAAQKRAEFFGASEEAKAKLEEKFDAKRAEIEEKAAERQKTIALSQAAIDVALSVLKASASAPPPLNVPAIIIASALGAIQLAIIAAQKFALGSLFDIDTQNGYGYFAKGAYLANGAYHSEGGMPIVNPHTGQKVAEIEKGEAIINKANTKKFYDELSFINSHSGKGVPFPNAQKLSYSQFNQNMKVKSSYGMGGSFGAINRDFVKLQTGALVSSDISRQSTNAINNSNSTALLLQELNDRMKFVTDVIKAGFGQTNSTMSEISKQSKIKTAGKNAR